MDEMVLQTQKWVNETYGGRPGYNNAPENGKTGWSTVYALTRALQLELGITSPADNFGPGTASKYKEWGEMVLGSVPTDTKGKRIVQIFQGACWCKGYNPGGFNGNFEESCKKAVIQLQTDAGLPVRDGKVYDYIFKAFLTMDAYRLTIGGNPRIREIQQNLNYSYYKTSGVQPCDGHYQRNTQKAIVYGLQTEMGIPAGSQTGTVGPATQNGLPELKVGSTGNFVKLFQYLLYVNNYDPGAFDGIYGSGLAATVEKFQKFILLSVNGVGDKQTWLSLLLSSGDPNRKGTACDCITTITAERAAVLKKAGYETVGRYLVNARNLGALDKVIKPGELDTIFKAGLTVFPIFQTSGDKASYFNYSQGFSDGSQAFKSASWHGFKAGTVIYFAVDYDALGGEISNNILPYFLGIQKQLDRFDIKYSIGVYGTRNVCSQVSDAGYAVSSFVSGMSTGFSGNLGFALPKNWAFDQISTIKIGTGDGHIEIDNNIKSGRYNGESSVSVSSNAAIYSKFLDIVDSFPLLDTSLVSDFSLNKEMVLLNTHELKVTAFASASAINTEASDYAIFSVSNGIVDIGFEKIVELFTSGLEAEFSMDLKEFNAEMGTIIKDGNIAVKTTFPAGRMKVTYVINTDKVSVPGSALDTKAAYKIVFDFKLEDSSWFDDILIAALAGLALGIGAHVAGIGFITLAGANGAKAITAGVLTALFLKIKEILDKDNEAK